MKQLQLFALFIFISSCCSTKRITETVPKEATKTVKAKDSIIKNTEPTEAILETDETAADTIPKEGTQNNDFNQVVTKRIIKAHEPWDDLLKKHVSNKGNVDYKGFKKDHKKLYEYFGFLNATLPNEKTSKAHKLAYWINAYNAFTIDLILRHYPIKSIKDIKDPWDQRYWKLGEKWYNLNEIEHDILRKMDEPRMHFGIVCASFSCPKLQNSAFTAENLDKQLTNATKAFLSDSNRNEISENSLKLSKIFQWFTKDFKQNGSLIDFLNKYSAIEISAKAKKSFKNYDWALNE